ncbi:HPr family phosphocarrier protein [Anoxybacterium hadale]|uniref:HPr family phosphocarrier protein n=1 Tax=Anoxybacterium hadale TaxID=3408580 RepID=A0ACD1AFE3_9FIRM|nr:HPr family phosphocarrier protein [Clostridiales bacterium]
MARQAVSVKNNTGLHARPAAEFAKIAKSALCEVYVEKDGKKANAKSVLGILSLAICKGNVIDIITKGEGEDAALSQLVSFIDGLIE